MKMILLYILLVVNTPNESYPGVPDAYRIGYSTNYGYGFKNRQSVIYNPGYRPTNTSKPTRGPRRSPQRPYSGNFLEDLVDWWRINTDENWPSYVDDDYWDQFLNEYPEYANEAEEWFKDHGQTPPWQTPIEDYPGWLLIILIFIYCKIKSNKIIEK